MNDELRFDLIKVLIKHKILPETFLRNEEIIIEYRNLRDAGVKGKEAMKQLSEKYFTSTKNIEFIIYEKKKFDKKKYEN